MIVHLDGDVVVKVDPVIGYLHRGIEKMAENRTYLQVVPLTDRLDYVGSMYANWAYCRAVERLAGIRVPERAEYLRVIVCELQRIASHMMSIGSSAADTGAFSMFIYAFDVRERIIELFEDLCGSRLTYNYVRPGGVSKDVPEGWIERVLAFTGGLAPQLDELDRLFFGNTITRGRLKGVGVLVRRGRGGVGRLGAGRARQRRELGPAQARRVLGLPAHGVRRRRGRPRRRVRPQPHPAAWSASSRPRSSSRASRRCPAGRQGRGPAAAARAAASAMRTTTSSPRAGRSASTWCPTAASARTG